MLTNGYLELSHHVLKPTSSDDLPHLLALLFLILLDDIFNPDIFEAERTPAQALYTTHLKGIAWEMVDFLDKAYTWETTDPTLDHPISTALNFQPAFQKLLGTQLADIKRLRRSFLKHHLTRPQDTTQRAKDAFTKALEKELEMVAAQYREVEAAYKAGKEGEPEFITPLLDELEVIQCWQAIENKRYRHRVLSPKERLVLGACRRDREELARSGDQLRPRILY